MNGAILFLNLKTILDTRIVILSALGRKLWPKTYFHEMVETIVYT